MTTKSTHETQDYGLPAPKSMDEIFSPDFVAPLPEPLPHSPELLALCRAEFDVWQREVDARCRLALIRDMGRRPVARRPRGLGQP